MSAAPVTFKQSLFQVTLSAMGRLAFLLVFILLYKSLPVTAAGAFALIYGLSAIFATISETGLRGLLIRELARTNPQSSDSQELVRGAITCRLLTAFPYFLTTFVMGYLLLPDGYTSIILTVMAACWLDSNANVLRGALRAFGHIVLDAALMATFRVILLAVVGGLYASQQLHIATLAYAFLFATFLDFSIAMAFVKVKTGRSIRLCNSLAIPISLLKRGLPFTILAILGMLYLRVGLIILGLPKTDGALENVAGFSLSAKIPEGVTFLPLALVGAAIPYLSKKASDKGALIPVFRNLELLLGALGIFTAVCLVSFSHVLIPIISQSKYLVYQTAFQIYGCTVIFTFLQYTYSNLLICLDQEKRVAWRYGVILVLNIVLNLAIDWKWGAVSAAAILLFCEICAMAVDLFYLKKSGFTLSTQTINKWLGILIFAVCIAVISSKIPGLFGLLIYLSIAGLVGLAIFYKTHNYPSAKSTPISTHIEQ